MTCSVHLRPLSIRESKYMCQPTRDSVMDGCFCIQDSGVAQSRACFWIRIPRIYPKTKLEALVIHKRLETSNDGDVALKPGGRP